MLGKDVWGAPGQEATEEFVEFSRKYDRDYFVHAKQRTEIDHKTAQDLRGGRVADFIARKRDERTPSIFTRMSDGEGNLLALKHDFGIGPHLLEYCLRRISFIHFGDHSIVPDNREFFGEMMNEALLSADLLGFAQADSILRHFDVEDSKKDVRAIVGNRVSYLVLQRMISSLGQYSDAWFSRGLLPSYQRLLGGEEAIGLISVYPELAGKLQTSFGIGTVDFIPVPKQAVFITPKERKNTGHYPDHMNRIIDSINPRFPGQIYVVAAGLLAKKYCTVIKLRGGIAIDVGSIAEVWMGIQARGLPPEYIEKWAL